MSQVSVYLATNRFDYTLTNTETGLGQTGAIVTATLLNGPAASSPPVTGPTWPVTLTELGEGVYRYVPPHDLLVKGRTYFAVGHAVIAGVHAHSEVLVICQRDSS